MDNEFWNSLKVTLVYTLYTVPGKLVMALAVAVFLNRNIKGINLIRTLYYIPSLFGGSVAVALLWKIMFMDNGVINAILTTLHLPNVQWLGDPNQALRTICMMEIWQFGSSMVMFLAALKTFRQICTKLPRLTVQARSRCSSASPFRKSPHHLLQPYHADHSGFAELYLCLCHHRWRPHEGYLCAGHETV